MSTIAQIIDGQIQQSGTISKSTEVKDNNSSLDKDAFLQLLVAQMKYQDPLQPTENTEYISQLATFSQLEEMQNMTAGMDLMRASGLVGQYVFMTTTGVGGKTTTIEGYVDSVVYEAGKAYLEIDGSLYSINDLDTVVDKAYINALEKISKWADKLQELPDVDEMTADEARAVVELRKEFESMSSYEQAFIGSDVKKLYDTYVNKMEELLGKGESGSGDSDGEE